MVGRGAALAAAAGVALAGCGGDDGTTRAQWAAQADRICAPALEELRAVSAEIDEVAAGAEPARIFAQSARLIRRSQAITTRAFDRIDGLDRPADDRDAIKAWVAANRRQNALAGQLARAFQAQDQQRIALLSEEIDDLNTSNNAFAKRFGARVCAQPI